MGDAARVAALRASAGAVWSVLRGRGHPRWRAYLRDTWGRPRLRHRGRPVVWLVGAAGGEVVQTAGFCPALRAAIPGATLVLSTTNHAFADVARRIAGLDDVFYTPWDLPRPAARALAAVRPDLLVTVESAWNPVLFRQARRRGVPTMLASGTIVADYHHAAPYRRPMRLSVLDELDVVGVKDEGEVEPFARLGVPAARVQVLGDLRLDPRFHTVSADEREALRARTGVEAADCVLVAGSVHAGEDLLVLDAARALRAALPRFRLVIAPRYLATVPAITRACIERGLRVARFTHGDERRTADVIVLDTYGDLARVYAVARYVFLGGSVVSIGLGLGQNLMEPLAQGVPVLCGPHMRRWQHALAALTEVYPRLTVTGADALAAAVVELEARPDIVAALRARAAALVVHGADAVARHVAAIEAVLDARAVTAT